MREKRNVVVVDDSDTSVDDSVDSFGSVGFVGSACSVGSGDNYVDDSVDDPVDDSVEEFVDSFDSSVSL